MNSNTKKTIIKRVKRNKKKITTGEKIMAGLGVGSSLFGLAGGGKAPTGKPQTVIASTQKDAKSASKTSKIKQELTNLFGVPKAKADDDSTADLLGMIAAANANRGQIYGGAVGGAYNSSVSNPLSTATGGEANSTFDASQQSAPATGDFGANTNPNALNSSLPNSSTFQSYTQNNNQLLSQDQQDQLGSYISALQDEGRSVTLNEDGTYRIASADDSEVQDNISLNSMLNSALQQAVANLPTNNTPNYVFPTTAPLDDTGAQNPVDVNVWNPSPAVTSDPAEGLDNPNSPMDLTDPNLANLPTNNTPPVNLFDPGSITPDTHYVGEEGLTSGGAEGTWQLDQNGNWYVQTTYSASLTNPNPYAPTPPFTSPLSPNSVTDSPPAGNQTPVGVSIGGINLGAPAGDSDQEENKQDEAAQLQKDLANPPATAPASGIASDTSTNIIPPDASDLYGNSDPAEWTVLGKMADGTTVYADGNGGAQANNPNDRTNIIPVVKSGDGNYVQANAFGPDGTPVLNTPVASDQAYTSTILKQTVTVSPDGSITGPGINNNLSNFYVNGTDTNPNSTVYPVNEDGGVIVQKGDTLSGLAVATGRTMAQIMEANGADPVTTDPNDFKLPAPGQELKIPAVSYSVQGDVVIGITTVDGKITGTESFTLQQNNKLYSNDTETQLSPGTAQIIIAGMKESGITQVDNTTLSVLAAANGMSVGTLAGGLSGLENTTASTPREAMGPPAAAQPTFNVSDTTTLLSTKGSITIDGQAVSVTVVSHDNGVYTILDSNGNDITGTIKDANNVATIVSVGQPAIAASTVPNAFYTLNNNGYTIVGDPSVGSSFGVTYPDGHQDVLTASELVQAANNVSTDTTVSTPAPAVSTRSAGNLIGPSNSPGLVGAHTLSDGTVLNISAAGTSGQYAIALIDSKGGAIWSYTGDANNAQNLVNTLTGSTQTPPSYPAATGQIDLTNLPMMNSGLTIAQTAPTATLTTDGTQTSPAGQTGTVVATATINSANPATGNPQTATGNILLDGQTVPTPVVVVRDSAGNYQIYDQDGNDITDTVKNANDVAASVIARSTPTQPAADSAESTTPAPEASPKPRSFLGKMADKAGQGAAALTGAATGVVGGAESLIGVSGNADPDTYKGTTNKDGTVTIKDKAGNQTQLATVYSDVNNIYTDSDGFIYVKNGKDNTFTYTGGNVSQLDPATAPANTATNYHGIDGSSLTAVGDSIFTDSKNNLYTLATGGYPILMGLKLNTDDVDSEGYLSLTNNSAAAVLDNKVEAAVSKNMGLLTGDKSKVNLNVSVGDDNLVHISSAYSDAESGDLPWGTTMTKQQFAARVIQTDTAGLSAKNILQTLKTLSELGNPLVLAADVGMQQVTKSSSNNTGLDATQPIILFNSKTGNTVVMDADGIDFVDNTGKTVQQLDQGQMQLILQNKPSTNVDGASVSLSDLKDWLPQTTGKVTGFLTKLGGTLLPVLVSKDPTVKVVQTWAGTSAAGTAGQKDALGNTAPNGASSGGGMGDKIKKFNPFGRH